MTLIDAPQADSQQQATGQGNTEHQRNVDQRVVGVIEMMGAHKVDKQRMEAVDR